MGTSEDNYWTVEGKRFAAIRIPDAQSQRRKRGVDHPEDIVNGDQPVESI
jgi:hypothetical protein